MKLFLVVVLSFLALADQVLGANKGSCQDGVCVKVLGQSGKISMAAVDAEEDIDSSDGRVTVDMDSLSEVDDQGNEVGKTGSTKHSFNSFASQTFDFSDLEAGDVQGVNATYFTFESQLKDLTSTLKVWVYIFSEEGEVTFANETQKVKKGSVKFTIDLTNWEWCGCKKGQTDETGAYVDFTIEIKGKGQASKSSSDDDTEGYDLGGGSTMKLSRKVEIDGTWRDMEDGYPKYEEQGSKQKFTFRFNRFNTRAFYDPTFELGSDGTGASARVISSLLVIVALLLHKLI